MYQSWQIQKELGGGSEGMNMIKIHCMNFSKNLKKQHIFYTRYGLLSNRPQAQLYFITTLEDTSTQYLSFGVRAYGVFGVPREF